MTQATTFSRGYDPATGQELWRLGGPYIPTPVLYRDRLYVLQGK